MATKITGTNTAAAPGVTGDDTDTGLFYGTNEIGFSTGGTSRLTLDSSGHLKFPDSGKIRLGTGNDLDIFHNSNINYIHSNNAIPLRITTGAETQAVFTANGSVDLYFDNTKRFETTSAGVQVTGRTWMGDASDSSGSGNAIWIGDSNDLKIFHQADNLIDSYGQNVKIRNRNTDGGVTENMITMSPNGAVSSYHDGIKVLNTAATGIEVRGAEGSNCELYMYADEGDDNADLWKFIVAAGSSSFYLQNKKSGSWETNIDAAGDGPVQLYYDNAKRLETDSNGIKVHSASTGVEIEMRTSSETYRGSVYANNSDYVGFLDHSGNWVFKTQRDIETEFHQTTIRSNADGVYDVGSSSYRWDDIRATNGTIQTSDKNEKNTIVESDLGLSFVNKLKPVSYKFNGKTRTHYGLIAQDVETTLSDISKSTTNFAGFIKDDIPEEKYQDKEPLPEGKAIGDVKREAFTRYGLRYAEFISPLVKAIQELSLEVETLKTKVATLEAS